MKNWIKTDDLQYIRKIKDGIYELAEARYAENKYLLCNAKITIADWTESDGNYDLDCREIISNYYESIQIFHENYKDLEFREQVLAEMIFESTPYYETEWKVVSEEDIEGELQLLLQ